MLEIIIKSLALLLPLGGASSWIILKLSKKWERE